MKIPALLVLIISARIAIAADWKENLNSLLAATTNARQDTLIEAIARAKPDWQEVEKQIEAIKYPEAVKGQLVLNQIMGIDGKERPWVVYVPPSYDPGKPSPLLIALHGGVSSPTIMDDPLGWAKDTPFKHIAEQRGYIVLFPFGQMGATWWDEVGMTNIRNLVRTAKQTYNVDDDRVYLGGFSDGGSAAFLFAMTMPSDFAAFVALNGHMGVGSEDGDLPTYATNFANSSVYAVTTDKDPLYPSNQMQTLIDMAHKAGGNIYYRQLEGDHSLSYADQEFPQISDFLDRHPRDPFPVMINWETAIPGFGACRWFAIDEIKADDPAPWYIDYNAAMVDSTISIGFIPNDSSNSTGVKVASLVDGDYLARRIGLKAGDIIIKANAFEIKNMKDLIKFKTTIRRGDKVTIVINRDQNELQLEGKMPAPKNYFVFTRKQPSAEAKVIFSANRIDIDGSRVGAFRVMIEPQMINLNQNLVINFNGKQVFDQHITPDLRFLLRNFLENRDRKLIYVNEVKIRL